MFSKEHHQYLNCSLRVFRFDGRLLVLAELSQTSVLRQRSRDFDGLLLLRRDNSEPDDNVKAAIQSVNDSRGTVFSVVISSRSTEAAKRVIELTKAHISNPVNVRTAGLLLKSEMRGGGKHSFEVCNAPLNCCKRTINGG